MVMRPERSDMARKSKFRKGTGSTTTGKVRGVKVDQTNWRRKLQTNRIKFDDPQKDIYLEDFRKHGLKGRAAETAGVTIKAVIEHRDNDPDFDEACNEAFEVYKDSISSEVRRRGKEGWLEPIFHKGERAIEPILDAKTGEPMVNEDGARLYRYTAVRKFSDRLLELEAKRADPTYREKNVIDIEGTGGGVIVVPAGMTPEQHVAECERANEEARKKRSAEEAERAKATKE